MNSLDQQRAQYAWERANRNTVGRRLPRDGQEALPHW
jgi:hypothetical protein